MMSHSTFAFAPAFLNRFYIIFGINILVYYFLLISKKVCLISVQPLTAQIMTIEIDMYHTFLLQVLSAGIYTHPNGGYTPPNIV